ncbi:MAG: right-handed parallel beta-helix repeat-containing protein [Candidatus Latescibacterota bacterium]
MDKRISSCFQLIGFIATILMGCSETVTVPVQNEPPKAAFSFDPLAVQRGANVMLSVSASDPDDDPLTVTWDVSRGTLNANNQGKTVMPWQAPGVTGVDTIWVSVTDGTHTVSISTTIIVGYLWNSDINTNVTWNQSNSPVVISVDSTPPRVAIPEISSLFIEEGVVVYVQAGLIFDVAGILVTNGTSTNPVVFRPNSRAPEPGFWEGMVGSTDPGSQVEPGSFQLHHTRITYAAESVLLTSGASAELEECQFYFSRDVALHHDSGSGKLIVRNCQITDNNGDGIVVSSFSTKPDSVVIVGNKISLNGGNGIVLDLLDPFGVTPIQIVNNEITRNIFYGIQLIQASYPTINQNSIHSNDRIQANGANRRNLRLEPGFIGTLPEIDASNNYWLSIDSLVIDQTVFDSRDDAQINTRVRFWPWLHIWP